MPKSEKNTPGERRPRRRKKPKDEGLRFEPPGPQTGDALRIVLRCGPSGEPIIDTLLTDSKRTTKIGGRSALPSSEAIRQHRRKQFEERVLPIALLTRRYVMDAKFVAEHGTATDMRRAIELMTENLDGLVDSILRVYAEISSPQDTSNG